MSAIELIRKAREKKKLNVKFDLPVGDEALKVMFTSLDILALQETRETIEKSKLAELTAKGVDKLPIDKELENDDESKNLAEQLAKKYSQIRTILEAIPKFLRDAETGEYLFKTEMERKEFQEYISSDVELLTLLTEKFGELSNKVAGVGEEAKNSSRQES